jgi:hypothetical protein
MVSAFGGLRKAKVACLKAVADFEDPSLEPAPRGRD